MIAEPQGLGFVVCNSLVDLFNFAALVKDTEVGQESCIQAEGEGRGGGQTGASPGREQKHGKFTRLSGGSSYCRVGGENLTYHARWSAWAYSVTEWS